jgi:gliding motility-associated-like protein
VTSPSFNSPASIQLGPNGKIYINSGSIDVINAPNNAGIACDYVPAVLNGGGYGLPKRVYSSSLIPSTIVYADSCFGNATLFSVQDTAGISNISWNFGDPASGVSNTATGFNVYHIFSQIGNYNVQAILTNTCGLDTLLLADLPIINCINISITGIKLIGDTCDINTNFAIQATGTSNSPYFFWNFGDPASSVNDTVTITGLSSSPFPTHTFSAPGVYNICVTFQEPGFPVSTICRTVSIGLCDSTFEDCQFEVPNVFTPNNDGLNDTFYPLTNCPLESYEFIIYNRWGQLIFNTTKQTDQWNGKFKNTDCSDGVYYYTLTYKTPTTPKKNASGTITLLR